MSCRYNKAVTVRAVLPEDIGVIARIEAETFSEPWSESALALLLTEEYPAFTVCDAEGELLGYISSQRALDELQIINLAVRAPFRGRGYGRLLVDAAEEYCRKSGIVSVSLEVRVSNAPAIALYEKCGYIRAGIRRGFYRDPREDAAVMIKNLN